MQAKNEHSPPTSRPSTIATESPRSPSLPATHFAGGAGADHDHVELAHAHLLRSSTSQAVFTSVVYASASEHRRPRPSRRVRRSRPSTAIAHERSRRLRTDRARAPRRRPAASATRLAAVDAARRRASRPAGSRRRQRPADREHAVAAEVPERVRDQPPVVPLHPAQDMRTRCRRRDRRPPRTTACANASGFPRFSPRKVSVPGVTCACATPSAPACIVTITTSARCAACATSRFAARDVREALRPRVRREADHGDADRRARSATAISPGRPVCRSRWRGEGRQRLLLADAARIRRMVVGEVEDREAGPPQPAGVRRRRVEREAARAARLRTLTSHPSRASLRGWRAPTSAARSVSTASKKFGPPPGGSFGVEPIMMSPTAENETTPAGIDFDRSLAAAGCVGVAAGSTAGAACTLRRRPAEAPPRAARRRSPPPRRPLRRAPSATPSRHATPPGPRARHARSTKRHAERS